MYSNYYLNISLAIILLVAIFGCNEEKTDHDTYASLFWKKDSLQVKEIKSNKGDLFTELGHHGPAIENEFYGLRLYFNNNGAIDVYSKHNRQLELHESNWYPDSLMQKNGFGSDQYKVGNTLGLGGIRLWDGNEVIRPIATKGRVARISNEGACSLMEILAYGVPYKNDSIDLLIRASVFSRNQYARIDAFALSDEPVEFVTGINYHQGHEIFRGKEYIGTWGRHPEDVAIFPAEIGAVLCFDKTDFSKQIREENQLLLIAKPAKQLTTYITTSISLDDKLNTKTSLEDFVRHTKPVK